MIKKFISVTSHTLYPPPPVTNCHTFSDPSRTPLERDVLYGRPQGSYRAAGAGVEPMTLRLKIIDSTKAPPRLTKPSKTVRETRGSNTGHGNLVRDFYP